MAEKMEILVEKQRRGARSNQKLKILYLAKILLDNTDANHDITLQEIIDKLSANNVTAERKSLYDDIARLDGHFNMGAVPGQSFIDGVIHDFINQMMQTGRACGTDIHAGALAHSFQPFQDLDLRAAVLMVGRRFAVGFGDDFF
mgnify:CR=1 FL=1